MSGRRGRGGGNQAVAAVANALGIARNDINKMITKTSVEPPALYPTVKRSVLPFEVKEDELQFMADIKQEIYDRFPISEFYLDKEEKKDIARYIDKYTKVEREKFRPDFSRLPDELCWVTDRPEEGKAKRKKLDEGHMLKIKLEKLEENEAGDPDNEDGTSDSEATENSDQENGAVSEDDGEEDNDYINNYFDNGEGYGDGGSDDNMDGDEY